MSEQEFEKGDHVSWSTHKTTTEGTVQKKITAETTAAGRKVKASDDEPQYLVKTDESQKEAVHKPGALDTT